MMWNCPSGSTGAGPSVGGTLTAPQIYPNFIGMPSDYRLVQMDSREQAESMQAQQMGPVRYQQYMQNQMPSPSFISANSVQSGYPMDAVGVRPNAYIGPQCVPTSSYVGCRQQFSNSQSMRPYSQPQMVQMQQHGVGVHPRDQQGFVNGSMYPSIPNGAQRTPGMAPSMIPSQVQVTMKPGCSSGMAPSPCGQFLRTRQPGPMNLAYQTAYSQTNQSSVVSIELVRVGSATTCSQLPSGVPQQNAGSCSDMNNRAASPTFASTTSESADEIKVAFCKEVIEYPIVLDHSSNSVEYGFVVSEENFAQLQRLLICLFSHYFSLQYVQWKPVRQVVTEILDQVKTDLASSKKKILNLIQMDSNNSRIRLWWSKLERMNVPARSVHCKHAACFDLESFLTLNCESETFWCPLCKVRFSWNDFEIDEFVANILSECGDRCKFSEAIIDPSSGCYQIVDLQTSVNCKQPQQRISMPCASNSGTVSQPVGNADVSRSLKRMVNNKGTSCQPSLKRLKPVSFASSASVCDRQVMSLPSSSTFNQACVPVTSVCWFPSPTAPLSTSSLCGFSSSPNTSQPGQQQQQQLNLSSVSAECAARGTPIAPEGGNNPACVGASASSGNTQLQNAVASQGNVEAISASGSAPYSPDSVGSSGSANFLGPSACVASAVECNASSSADSGSGVSVPVVGSGGIAVKTGNPIVSKEVLHSPCECMTVSELEMYLKDEPFALSTSSLLSSKRCPPRSIDNDEDWLDFKEIMARDGYLFVAFQWICVL
uniref:SP-RING-type domain-containing protein n=1 Tax=Syphacia muris TaxID=451379 RepID=A0A0N5AY54_9BILA